MDLWSSISDVFPAAPGLSVWTVALDLALAFVLGQSVAWLYTKTHRGLSYSRNLVHSLVLLCMIVTMVMLVVGDSVARAFGLVGALAIIRFRTVMRDARDTTFIFLGLAIGIAIGAHQYTVAVGGVVLIGAAATLLQYSGFGTRHADTGILRVEGSPQLPGVLEPLLSRLCRHFELIALREGSDERPAEYSYRVRLVNPKAPESLREKVAALVGASAATLVLEPGAEEW